MANHDLSSMDYGEEEFDKALWGVGFRRDLRKQQREIINDVQSKLVEVLVSDRNPSSYDYHSLCLYSLTD